MVIKTARERGVFFVIVSLLLFISITKRPCYGQYNIMLISTIVIQDFNILFISLGSSRQNG